MQVFSLPDVAVQDAIFVAYLRRVMARCSGRPEVYGEGHGDDFHPDVIGALAEVAVVLTRPEMPGELTWFGLTAHAELPKVDLALDDKMVDVHEPFGTN